MKKYILIALTVLAAATSCSTDYDPYEQEMDGSTHYTGAYTRAYLQQICDNLIIQNLQMLENALALQGNKLWQPSASYESTNRNDVQGLLIRKADADSTWILTRSDDFPINDISFPTEYTITAKMAALKSPQAKAGKHSGWDIEVNGKRIEDKGFACSFYSDGIMSYRTNGYTSSYTSWSSVFGIMYMKVFCDAEQIDLAMLEFSGNASNPFFANQL